MTFLEAFRNRGLLEPERHKPIYAIAYGNDMYNARYIRAEATTPQTAKQELAAAWDAYADKQHVCKNTILAMWCIGNDGAVDENNKRLDFLRGRTR